MGAPRLCLCLCLGTLAVQDCYGQSEGASLSYNVFQSPFRLRLEHMYEVCSCQKPALMAKSGRGQGQGECQW